MKMNSPEKLLACLENLEPRIELPADIIERASLPIERMLAVR
jgi:quinolinate synthase